MAKNLMIVESPAKARTIAKYLGKDFDVASSYGHIRDLPKKGMSVDIEHDFKPTYEIPADKKQAVRELKKAAKTVEAIWLATDEDREGEAIAWHLAQALGLDDSTVRRIVFHEITEPAIKAAIASPDKINQKLVDAQQARRILDRLVGYELSPILWKKIHRGLSAGRVQSVAVRLVVEREREIRDFKPQATFKVTAELATAKGETFAAELAESLADQPAARTLLEQAKSAKASVAKLLTKPATKNSPPPFTTSTLQQAAARSLGFSVRQTMVVAQQLYEAGHITYMRTDSLNLAESAIKQAAQQISQQFGPDYVATRTYKTKIASAQEAHEAIRPTDLATTTISADGRQHKLYSLIWRRTMASQMKPAELERTEARIALATIKPQLIAKGEMVKFDGWLRVYADTGQQTEAKLLPKLHEGEPLRLLKLQASETYSRAKPRYSEASLVKKLESLGIGRPSTYAPTISTIQTRGYVARDDFAGQPQSIIVLTLKDGKISQSSQAIIYGADRKKLLPTDVGEVVTDFLVKHFPEVIDYQFTAKVEADFDRIAKGQEAWQNMLKAFYGPFHQDIKATEKVSRQEAMQARELGLDPKSGKPVIARLGRYGPMVQIGQAEDEVKPRFAPIPKGQKLEELTLKTALKLFELPRVVGQTVDGKDITAAIGRYGPYLKTDGLSVSLKDDDPYTIIEQRARDLIAAKHDQLAEKIIKTFPKSSIQVLNGRYGPYVSDGQTNAPVPKDQTPSELSLAQCQDILAAKRSSKNRNHHNHSYHKPKLPQ
ncbi:type I DNA topoisomerase [Candidatus Microgenomates bacterium]|nr:type I DNA topoisomerase [Candidatus Microgenomates bacterium]